MKIVFVGFRCSGKSTVGKAVAEAMKCPFIDADDHLERREETTISRIFEDQGETRFRTLETEVLKDLSRRDHCVISTGGGALASA